MSERESRIKRVHITLATLMTKMSKRNGLSELECSKEMAKFLTMSKEFETLFNVK